MKRMILSVLCLCLVLSPAFADPLPLLEEYAQDVVQYAEEGNPDSVSIRYSYRFPHVDPEAPGGMSIDLFYLDLVDYTESFTIPMNMDSFEETDSATDVTYTVTCNSDDWFSVLLKTDRISDGRNAVHFEGQIFTREEGSAAQTVNLPRLLGILDRDENDEWLQTRQTEKANTLIRDLVWEAIDEGEGDVAYFPDLTRDMLSHFFFPEEDFYLNEEEDPVFFIQPGYAAPESAGLLTFCIPLEEIEDEM